MSLSILALSEWCMRPFLPACEILEGGPCVCDLSQHVANMFGNSSPLISAHMRYCGWETSGRLGKEEKWPRNTLTHIQTTRKHSRTKESWRQEGNRQQLTVTAFLIEGYELDRCDWSHNGKHISALCSSFSWQHFLYGTLCYGIIIMPVPLERPRNKSL